MYPRYGYDLCEPEMKVMLYTSNLKRHKLYMLLKMNSKTVTVHQQNI